MKLSRNSLILIIIELLIVLCLLPGLLRKTETVMDDNPFYDWTLESSEGQSVYESHLLTISRGVYEILVDFDPASEEGIFLNADVKNPYHYGAFCDLSKDWYVPHVNSKSSEKRAYILDPSAEMKFTLAVPVGSDCGLSRITVTRTNAGARVVLVLVLVAIGLVDLCIYVRKRVLAGKMDFASQLAFWSIIGCAMYTLLPELTDCLSGNAYSIKFFNEFQMIREQLRGPDLITAIPLLLYRVGFPAQYAYKISLLIFSFVCSVISYFVFKVIFSDKKFGTLGMYAFMLSSIRLNAMFKMVEASIKNLAISYIGALLVAGLITAVLKLILAKFGNRKHLIYIVWGLTVVLIFLIAARLLDTVALTAEPMWIY